jgi:hypothetical protein
MNRRKGAGFSLSSSGGEGRGEEASSPQSLVCAIPLFASWRLCDFAFSSTTGKEGPRMDPEGAVMVQDR